MNILGTARRAILGFPLRENNYEKGCLRRGINPGVGLARRTLEEITRTVFAGFHTALETPSPATLKERLEKLVPSEHQGFLHEGATMGLAVLDAIDPLRRDRFGAFLEGSPTQKWAAFALGYGLASARLPWARKKVMGTLYRFDSWSRWFVIDGFGFHDGMFRMKQALHEHLCPSYLEGFAAQIYDQGLGRSIWFSQGADLRKITTLISRFPQSRHKDLWAGLGFASTFAGGAEKETLQLFAKSAGENRPHMAMGAAMAASCRKMLGDKPRHTILACKTICQVAFDEAAELVEACWSRSAESPQQAAYAACREQVANSFSQLNQNHSSQDSESYEATYGGFCNA